MAIILITGSPGAGKTLLTLFEVEKRRQSDGRAVYYNGIANLNLPWTEFAKPDDWNTLPVGSIIVIDECQRLLRPRFMGSKIPEYVEEFETHRHKGYDIYLITQHPMLIDNHVRRLCESHKHVMRKFGSTWATVHEWKGVKDNCDKTRKDSVSKELRYPREVYSWYKSSELHTHKFKIPLKVLLGLLLIPAIIMIAAYWYYSRIHLAQKPTLENTAKNPLNPQIPLVQGQPGVAIPVSLPAYLASYTPRVTGLPWTSPRYDALTQPLRVPTIRGCWLTERPLEGFSNRAVCMLDGGVYVYPPETFVVQYLRDRFFIDWENPRAGDIAASTPRAGDAATAGRPASASLLP